MFKSNLRTKINKFADKAKVSLTKAILLSIALAFVSSITLSPLTLTANAAVNNPTPKPRVSFTFDDGFQSAYTKAAPTLAKYGYKGTSYVTTGCIGMTTVPNTCRADQDNKYMTWAEATALQNTYGWEIGSHTVTHPYLDSYNANDGQPAQLTPAQVTNELAQSKQVLNSKGFAAKSFASPYGDYSPFVLSEVAKYYTSHRGFADTGYNTWPYSDYYLVNQPVQAGISVATVKGYVDQAIANNKWLVLTFHEIRDRPSNKPSDYQYSTSALGQIAAYIKSKNVSVTNVSDNIVTGDNDKLSATGSFNNGISGGWTTDAPTSITHDTANNGSTPSSTSSIKFVGGSQQSHLYSPQVSVSSSTQYVLKNYLNVKAINGGEVGFYIDEYNSAGNWISGKWGGRETDVFAQNFNFSYTPSSNNVVKASLQIYMTANPDIEAYLDNVQWYPLSSEPVAPTPTELLTNTTFDAGLAGGWTTDGPTTITADATNKGAPSNPLNSIKLTSLSTGSRHLFSPLVSVSQTNSYSISNYLNITQLASGEIGYYIDEYDINGNWISGQYKGGARTTGARINSLSYTPSSSSVAKASLQVIVDGGSSNIIAYFDQASWTKNL